MMHHCAVCKQSFNKKHMLNYYGLWFCSLQHLRQYERKRDEAPTPRYLTGSVDDPDCDV